MKSTTSVWAQLHLFAGRYIHEVDVPNAEKHPIAWGSPDMAGFPQYDYNSLCRTVLREWDMGGLVTWVKDKMKECFQRNSPGNEVDYAFVRMCMRTFPEDTHNKACAIMGIDPVADKLRAQEDYT